MKLGVWIRVKICLRPEGARDKQALGQEGRGQAQDGYSGSCRVALGCWGIPTLWPLAPLCAGGKVICLGEGKGVQGAWEKHRACEIATRAKG